MINKVYTTFLLASSYFHVCDGGLVPDVMHDILEGALQYEMKLLLKRMIDTISASVRKLRISSRIHHVLTIATMVCTIDTFNSRLINTELGYMEISDQPTPLAPTVMSNPGHSLKQSGKIVLS